MRQELLAVALEAAHRAGEVLVERLWGQRQVVTKGYRDVVTDADTAAEAVVLSLIRARFPDHAILSEEAGRTGSDSPYVWVVDPLDGTTNYSHRHPVFSVSIAVMKEGEPAVGVVRDPLRGHTFAACRGQGATLNGKPIEVSPFDRLEDAIVALDWGHTDVERERVLRRLVALVPRCRTVRVLGSAALALAYVGAGWLELYFNAALGPWDAAAASLIITEAGGRLSGLEGEPWQVGQPGLLATNGLLHSEVLVAWENLKRDA